MVDPAIFGPIDALAPVAMYVLLVLILVNLYTRHRANARNRDQAEDGADAVTRYLPHEVSNVLLVLMAFYVLTLDHHDGIVLSVLVVGTVLADFFEFEARLVEARQELPIEAPKSAIVGSLVLLLYTAYLSVFFVVAPVWNAIV